MPKAIKKSDGAVNPEYLLKERDMQIALRESEFCLIEGGGYLILDYGKELCGGVRILTYAVNGRNAIRIRFGESLGECSAELGEKNATNDHSLRDIRTQLVSWSDMEFGQTGFRFVRIDFEPGAKIALCGVYAVYTFREKKRLGSFECSDSLINQIYETAAYTAEICAQNMLWDGVKRDRLVWIGDAHTESLTLACLFGADEYVEKALIFARNHTPDRHWINEIPAYSCWWILILCDYYRRTGNKEFTERNIEYIDVIAKMTDECFDDSGQVISETFTQYFLDWQTKDTPAEKAGTKALMLWGFKEAKKLFIEFKRDDRVLERVERKLSARFEPYGESKQAAAMKYLAGVPDEGTLETLLKGGAKGVSTFMSYYILRALSENGKTGEALEMMKEYFGGMLSRGATSFWEDFDIEWLKGSGRIDEFVKSGEKDLHGDFGGYCYKGFRHSLCHGWASGPVPFLTENVLGIKASGPTCKKIKIEPYLGDLKWVRGEYPTPYGVVRVCHKKQNGEIISEISVPQEIEIVRD